MTTTCHSFIEDAIQNLLQGHTNSTNNEAHQEGPAGEWQRLKVKADALESQVRVLRDAKRATDTACDLEPLSRSQNTIESAHEKSVRRRRRDEERLSIFWKDDSCEAVGDPAPRILEWTEKTIEGVIRTLTQEQAEETCKDTNLQLNLPWNSPLVTGPLIVRDQLQQRLSPPEKQLADLRWRQNSLIPIARVLPELLIDIFELVLDAANSYTRDDTNRLLMVLARICRDWTRLIFNTPCLWSCISSKRSAMKHVAVALARSQPGPLSVSLDAANNWHIIPCRVLGAIKRHAGRLKVLNLYLGSSTGSVDALNSIFANLFAPRLETLGISLRDGVSESAVAWPEISFFKGPWHDALQNLRLNGVRLPPGGYGELRGLRSLELTPRADQMMFNTAEILRALSNSPSLEILHIRSLTELGGELGGWTANLVIPMRFDRLREITLRLPPASLRAILRSILPIKLFKVDIGTAMPQESRLAWTEVLLTNEIQPFVQAMESALHSTPQISIHSQRLHVNLWTGSKDRKYNTPRVELSFTGDRLAEVGRWMATSLDLGSADVTLYITDESTPWMDTAPFMLSKFHNTVKLNLNSAESVAQRVIDFLSTPLYTDSTGSQHFPVPRLVSLSAEVHDPSSIISMLERRYIQHGSTDVTNTRYPVALSSLRLLTDTVPSAPYSTLEQRAASFLPGCNMVLIRL